MPDKNRPTRARIDLPPRVWKILKAISAEGGRPLLVGGYVRDHALSRTSKDLDIEVHCLGCAPLEEILGRFGEVDLVGQQFGVYRLHGLDVDWSIPRRDSMGRHPVVAPDPWMGIEAAARRRDLTLNAMAIDPFTLELLDPFGGLKDIEGKILRATDPDLFLEDPLRFFRVMAFTGRLEMRVDPVLSRICKDMDLTGVARERIEEEFAKLFLKGVRPSLGLRWLQSMDRLAEILPEAALLVGLEQDRAWHPEGDVWEHTLQVIDAAARLRIGDRDQDLMLLWAALGHDLGKAETTQVVDGRIRSLGHAELAEKLVPSLMGRFMNTASVIQGATKLAVHHLKPHDFFTNSAGSKAFKRLAVVLAPETRLERLAALALADYRGRNPEGDLPLNVESEQVSWFLGQAERLKVEHEPEKAVLMGRHLMGEVEPGPEMGELLRRAYEIQLCEGIHDVETLKSRVLEE